MPGVRTCLLILLYSASFCLLKTTVRAEDEFTFFESKVRPLLVQHCYECHSGRHGIIEAGFNMDTRAGMLAGGDRGIAIVAGKPQSSLLVEAIRYSHTDLEMPPSGRLVEADVESIVVWIRDGAKMPEGKAVAQSPGESDSQDARNHWAFKQLSDHRRLKSDSEVVDYWIRRRQRQGGVRMQKEAEATALIRRLSLTLRGLPPSLEDIRRYVRSPTESVYANLVNQYLGSPGYGERWARHWLDLVRYTDTTASWLKSTAGAWRYRDWVIGALNDDVSYDQFVKMQFAADSMAQASAGDLRALGMLGLSPTYWKEPRLAPVVLETVIAEEWEERIDMVGRTFLGMSLACARCHDHKFDPVSQKDYYSLAGVFANIRVLDVPMMTFENRKKVIAADAEIRDLNSFIQREELTRFTAADKAIHDEKIKEAKQRIEDLKKVTQVDVEKVPGIVDASVSVIAESEAMSKVVYDDTKMVNVALQHRGNPGNKGDVVVRRFLRLFDDSETGFVKGSGRQELAEALFEHASFLMARVIVNRVWGHHFGQHLVDTPSNLGLQGDVPTHPELLDALALRLIVNGWSLKWLHRTILESDTFKQASRFSEKYSGIDPENRMYWSVRRRRLDIEAWRDSMLEVSGRLDSKIGGEPVALSAPENNRRTIYALIKRRELDDVLKMHGFPEPTGHSPKREEVDTPLQQLYALNSEFIWDCAIAVLDNIQVELDAPEMIEQLYKQIYRRLPTDTEVTLGIKFLAGDVPSDDRLVRYVHALLITNEFAFVE